MAPSLEAQHVRSAPLALTQVQDNPGSLNLGRWLRSERCAPAPSSFAVDDGIDDGYGPHGRK